VAEDSFVDLLGAWTLTYLLHSTVLLAAAGLVSRALGLRRIALQEVLWRAALLGGIATSALQVGAGCRLLAPATFLGVASRGGAPAAATAAVTTATDAVAAAEAALPAPSPPAATAALDLHSGGTPGWDWVAMLAAIQLGVAACGLASLAVCWWRLHRCLGERRDVHRGPLLRTVHDLRERLGVRRPVRLSICSGVQVPVAVGTLRPEICLPPRAVAGLDAAQLRTLLAHELAHVRAFDPAWVLLVRLVERALWLQPLNLLARKRLHDLAEYRCDDVAVRETDDAAAFASCLVEVASWPARAAERAARALAPAMPGPRCRLELRVERVLSGDADAEADAPRRGPRLLALGLCVAALGLPSFSLAAPPPSAWAAGRAEADAGEAGDAALGSLAQRLTALADVQRRVAHELAALTDELAELADGEQWRPLLHLLQERTLDLQRECAALHAELIESLETPPTQRNN
jgi:beta-lactamase regulating signal transducer with metallopeptidase domain